MATAPILHVGEDLCQRILVLEKAGFSVLKAEDSIPAIRKTFAGGDTFSAIILQSDFSLLPVEIVRTTRTLSAAPLVLFSNPAIYCDEGEFDLVIPTLTPPSLWIEKLREVIDASMRLRERSVQLRQECEETRTKLEALCAESRRLSVTRIDADAIWRGESNDTNPKK